MSTMPKGTQIRMIDLGLKVDRAAANLPQTAAADIFLVTVGRVLITSIIGEVTTIVQNQANVTKLQAAPTAGSTVDLCATTDIANLEVGGKLSVAGAAATALVKANAGAVLLGPVTPGILVAVGSIKLNCGASNTGQVKWSVTYIPYDDGALVAAA